MKRVEYDINKSEYFLSVNQMIFYFSSEFNKVRFERNYNLFIEEETNKLRAKYKVNIDLYDYLLIVFYKKIEKRGFRVLVCLNNGIINLKENHTFKVMIKI